MHEEAPHPLFGWGASFVCGQPRKKAMSAVSQLGAMLMLPLVRSLVRVNGIAFLSCWGLGGVLVREFGVHGGQHPVDHAFGHGVGFGGGVHGEHRSLLVVWYVCWFGGVNPAPLGMGGAGFWGSAPGETR